MITEVFNRHAFDSYRVTTLMEAYSSTLAQEGASQEEPVSIFLSHRHADLDDTKGIIGYLTKNYNVLVYIDSQDPTLPSSTCVETAKRIKRRISSCKKFIFLATNGAIESKWCNWELGYGDAYKFDKDIAILAMKDSSIYGGDFNGKEYMEMYPSVVFSDENTPKESGGCFSKGLYVKTTNGTDVFLTAFDKWLEG